MFQQVMFFIDKQGIFYKNEKQKVYDVNEETLKKKLKI